MPNETTKRHARTRRGCLTCRIRKKKCDSLRPSCTKCTRLHVQCLGYASDRPDWLKGDSAKKYTTAIKCFLSEYPAAKAYSDPVPFLVLKTTPEVEQWLAREPGAYNPVYFDPDMVALRQWTSSAPPQPPQTESRGVTFPATTPSGDLTYTTTYPMPGVSLNSHEPHTPSPEIPYGYPPGSHQPVYTLDNAGIPDAPWVYPTHDLQQPLHSTAYVPSQPAYDHSLQHNIFDNHYYNPEAHSVHYVAGPMFSARQGTHPFATGKTRFDEAGSPVIWMT